MSLSLTKDEFIERLMSRRKLLLIAVGEDFVNVTASIGSQQMAELAVKTLERAITLVYSEDLD